METRVLDEILGWMRTTDLVELSYRRGTEGFEFRTESAPPAPAAFPSSSLVPVCSTAIGVFRFSKPGSAPRAQEGGSVGAGDSLGLVETGFKNVEISAPSGGRVVKVLAQDGAPVEFGQPLFLIAP